MNLAAIDLRLLRSFLATVRLGSVTRAAHALHLTQPALSQHLRELAQLLDLPLFDRVGRGLVPTPAGSRLFAQLEPLVEQLDAVLTSAQASASEVRGRLRVAAVATYSRALVMPVVGELVAHYPRLTVVTSELPAPAVDLALREGEADIGLAFSHLSDPDIEQRELFREALVLIRRRAPRAGTAALALAEVARQPLVLLQRGFTMRRQVDAVFARAGLQLDVRAEADDVEAMLRLAAQGGLATIATTLALHGRPGLVARPIAHPDLVRSAALRWRRGRSPAPAAERFADLLLRRLRAQHGIELAVS